MKVAPPKALAELQRWPHWVIWREEERDGRPTKVPYQARYPERRASSTDPATWATHMAAKSALAQGKGDGIGYVFAEDDEYAGIDLDHCVIDGKVAFGARAIVDRLASYTELSPSGTGLHVIVRAGLNGGRNRTKTTSWGGDFEAYDRGRFFTITGEHLAGTPTTIESRQEELDAIRAELFPAPATANVALTNGKPPVPVAMDDHALLEKIRLSRQGPKFAELYDRGAPEGQESESDLGLCNILAFWCGPDDARIDSLFRSSALMRDKWDSPRGETTYGGYTINRALEGRTEFYGQKKTAPAAARFKDDNPEMPYAEEISTILGLIDDPIVSGWRSKRGSAARVVFTTRDGRTLDIDSWKAATTSARVLAQEVALQLGVEAALSKESISRLNVLVGLFCEIREAMTIDHRARQLGSRLLAEAREEPVDWTDQDARYTAFQKLKEVYPVAQAKTKGTSIGAEVVVLVDTATGKRYVPIQWFIDYVKANAVSSTAGPIVEAIEQPGWWSRPNAQGRFKARDPEGGKPLYMVMFEVPADWDGGDDAA
jgi:hypothetical protein